MSEKNDALIGAVLANNAAWSTLVQELVNLGVVDPNKLFGDLRCKQLHYSKSGLDSVAEALDWHVGAIEDLNIEK